ncbi:hypothetical protein VTH82DRAFT_6197 [Thermothelomyces myriococcoides]
MYNNTAERGVRHNNINNPNAATAGAPAGMTYGQSAASGPAPTTAGHHKHDILNKLDPRVDSTHDRQPMTQTNSKIPEGTYGPHSSRLANALDPRVDSDLDSTRAGAGVGAGGGLAGRSQPAAAAYGAGSSGGVPEGTYGPHRTRAGNALDPSVDSDRDHRGAGHHHLGGPAPPPATGVGAGAANTSRTHNAHTVSGPHSSGLMNKLDPRVDSTTGARKSGTGSWVAY